MKIIFMGTPKFSAYILNELIKNEFDIIAVVTKEDKRRGRNKNSTYSEVKIEALNKQIPILQPNKMKDDDFINKIKILKPDIIVTAAYGKIIPKEILNIPVHGCINVHASLLPKYRGASPIQSAIMNGDKSSGVTIIQMDEGMDTGDILMQESMEILPNDNVAILFDKMAILGAKLCMDVIRKIEKNQIVSIKQCDEDATYTHLISKEEGHINFNLSAIEIVNKIRAIDCYCFYNDMKIKILKAKKIDFRDKESISNLPNGSIIGADIKKGLYIKCGMDVLEIRTLQLPGKKAIDAISYINGYKPKIYDIWN